jgi:hypothetical protein
MKVADGAGLASLLIIGTSKEGIFSSSARAVE